MVFYKNAWNLDLLTKYETLVYALKVQIRSQNCSFSTFLVLHINVQHTPYSLGIGHIHIERGENLILAETSHLEYALKQLSTCCVFHEHSQMGGSQKYLLEANYVGMSQRYVINNLLPQIFINLPILLCIVLPPPCTNPLPIRSGSSRTQPIENKSTPYTQLGGVVTQLNENSTGKCGADLSKIQPHQGDLDQCYHPRNNAKL